jgi:hypothetical protein
MRSAAIYPRCLCFVFLIIISHFYEPLLCWAQANDSKMPRVSLTIFLAPEKEACKPYGYRTYGDESTKCAALTFKDIDRWREAGFLRQTIEIRPAGIALTNRIIEFLDIYREIPKDNPERRRTAVFIFKWATPQQSPVSQERRVSNNSEIPPMKWSAKLDNERMWIFQQRADALLPSYQNKWILKAGNRTWTFYFVTRK